MKNLLLVKLIEMYLRHNSCAEELSLESSLFILPCASERCGPKADKAKVRRTTGDASVPY